MSQLTNSSSQFKTNEKTDNDNVLINIYNTNKETEITLPSTMDENKDSNNTISQSSSTPNNNKNVIENPFKTPPSSNTSSPIPSKNNINTSTSNISTPSFNNNINTPITNNSLDTTNNQKQNKDEIVNIDILNPDENSVNTSTDINVNFKPSIDENTNNPNKNTKQFNLNSPEKEEENKENITANTSILENGRNYNKSYSSKKTVKTAITFDLNQKKRIEKNNSDTDNDSDNNIKEKKKVSEYCPVCKAKASFMCSSCGPVVFYCSQSCQIAHWPEHRLVCKGVKKRKSIVEHKKTESIFGEIVDPTIGSDAVVGTRNVAQLINLKRSRTENGKSKTSSILSNRKNSTTHLLNNAIEEEENEEEYDGTTSYNKDDDNKEDVITPLTGIKTDSDYMDNNKLKNSDDDLTNTLSTPANSENDGDENEQQKDKKKKLGYRKRTSMLIAKAQEDEELMEDLKFYIKQIFLIIKPVLVCIFLTITWVKLTNDDNMMRDPGEKPRYVFFRGYYFKQKSPSFDGNNSGGNILSEVKEALKFILQMILVTVVVALLFIFSCVKTLTSLYIILMLVLLSVFSYITLHTIVSIYNIPIDLFTTAILIWNVVVVGLVVIFWRGPLKVQQYYLVFVSSLMAYSLSQFSEWTTWIILGLLAIWDLVAVLCPFGPLRLLLKHSEDNQQEIPALLYTLMVWIMATPSSPKIKGTIENKNVDSNSNTHHVNNKVKESSSANKAESSNKTSSSKPNKIETSFSNEILSIYDIKNANSSPPVSPIQILSSNNNSISKRNSNLSNSGSSITKQQNSRPMSVSSVSSGSVTLSRKKNLTLKRYPSNSSITGSRNRPSSPVSRPSSPNGSVILTNRPPSVSLRPYFTGSISDENATTASLFQENSNSIEGLRHHSLSHSRNSSVDSQYIKKRIDKKYKYPNSNSEISRLYSTRPPSDRRINRHYHHHHHHYSQRSAYASNHSYDNDSSFLSDDSTSDFHGRETSFSSVVPLVNNKSHSSSLNDYSSHSHHHHHKHHHHNDTNNDSNFTVSQTSSTTSGIHHTHSHRRRSHYSSVGPSSYGFLTEEEYQKKKKRERRLRKERERKERQRKEDEEEEAERNGIKLGLGDFVFYSVLVAKAAAKDWMTTINCTVAVITGLTITIFLLALLKKALPALPISIAFGLVFYFASQKLISGLINATLYVAYFSNIKDRYIFEIYKQSITEVKQLFNNTVTLSQLTIGKKYMGFVHL